MNETLPGLLASHADKRPDEVALREKEFGIWQEITWAEYLGRVRAFSLGLSELGVERGDRVAIIGDNRPEWMIAELAAQAGGVLPLGLYQDSIAGELARMLETAEARVIVAEDQEQVDKVLEVRDRLPGLEYIVYYDPRGMYGYEAPGLMAFEEVEALGERRHARSPEEFDEKLAAVRSGDIALLCTTSGTTSIPKLAMLSHENLLAMAAQLRSVDAMNPGDEFVSFLPLAWIGEQMVSVASGLLAGFTVNFPEEVATARKDMREIGPAFLMSPPRIWENMVSDVQVMAEDTTRLKRWAYGWAMKHGAATAEARFRGRHVGLAQRLRHRLADWMVFHPIRDQLGLSRVRRAYTGGAALGPDVFRFYHAIGVNLKQLYGQTEVSGISVMHRDGDIRFQTVGEPLPRTEIRISGEGEILCRSPAVFRGYFHNPEATAETLEDGWLRSGDAGYFDEQRPPGGDRPPRRRDEARGRKPLLAPVRREQAQVQSLHPRGGGLRRGRGALRDGDDRHRHGERRAVGRTPPHPLHDLHRPGPAARGERPRARTRGRGEPGAARGCPDPPFSAAAQGAARRRRRTDAHAQGAAAPHRRSLRGDHQRLAGRRGFGDGGDRDHLSGRAHRSGGTRTAHRDDGRDVRSIRPVNETLAGVGRPIVPLADRAALPETGRAPSLTLSGP